MRLTRSTSGLIKAAEDLRQAAEEGNVDDATTILDNYPAVLNEIGGEHENTALIAAAHKGHIPVVEMLLDRDGIAVDVQNKYGYSALLLAAAAEQGHTRIVELLLQSNCAVDLQNRDKNSALIFAAYWGRTPIVRMLLLHGANLDLRTNAADGDMDALAWAKEKGHTEIASLIKKEGCWRRRKAWVMFLSMYKASLLTATAPLDETVVERALAMDEITRLIAMWL